MSDNNREKMPQIIKALSVPVVGTNVKTGIEIKYNSMNDAKKDGFSNGKISLCCAGKRLSHKGYYWRKVNVF